MMDWFERFVERFIKKALPDHSVPCGTIDARDEYSRYAGEYLSKRFDEYLSDEVEQPVDYVKELK